MIDTCLFHILLLFQVLALATEVASRDHRCHSSSTPSSSSSPCHSSFSLSSSSPHSCPAFCARLEASKVSLWSCLYTPAQICSHSRNNFFASSTFPCFSYMNMSAILYLESATPPLCLSELLFGLSVCRLRSLSRPCRAACSSLCCCRLPCYPGFRGSRRLISPSRWVFLLNWIRF